ncbi:hypothetical protein BDD12DRAFT_801121 [Trichophaea hybrida]|nr:hypothetical protein BDD12DRAFT_801121 [Trichophaea hybrida]
MLKEFSFLPKSSSTSEVSVDDGTPAGTPRKKGWGRAPPVTPTSKEGNPSVDLLCSDPPSAAMGKRKRTPSSPTPVRTVTISANESITVLDGDTSSTSSLTTPTTSPDDSGDIDILHEISNYQADREGDEVLAPVVDDVGVVKYRRNVEPEERNVL